MTINTAAIRSLLEPTLNAIFGDYDEIPTRWSEIFAKNTAEKAVETDVEMKYTSFAFETAEGVSTTYEDMGERSKYVYVMQGLRLGFIITAYAIKDNLYKSRFGPQTRTLKFSFRQTKEVRGANVLNNAFSSSYTGGDGVSLCNTGHPTDGANQSNTFTTQADLNETSLQDMLTDIRQAKDVSDAMRISLQPEKLIVPAELEWTAIRLLRSELRVSTGDNDINAVKYANAISGGFSVNEYLTDSNAWFIKTNCPDGLKYFERDQMETSMQPDFDTDNLKVKGHERYAFGWSNWRGIYGTSGVS